MVGVLARAGAAVAAARGDWAAANKAFERVGKGDAIFLALQFALWLIAWNALTHTIDRFLVENPRRLLSGE